MAGPIAEWMQPNPWQIIPLQYQGYVLLAFCIFAVFAILYGFYLIATDTRFAIRSRIPDKKKGSKK